MGKPGVPPRKAQKCLCSTRGGSAYTVQRESGIIGRKEQMKPAEEDLAGDRNHQVRGRGG